MQATLMDSADTSLFLRMSLLLTLGSLSGCSSPGPSARNPDALAREVEASDDAGAGDAEPSPAASDGSTPDTVSAPDDAVDANVAPADVAIVPDVAIAADLVNEDAIVVQDVLDAVQDVPDASGDVIEGCASQPLTLGKVPPDILMILDRSGSMALLPDGSSCGRASTGCGPLSKWAQVTQAVHEVVTATASTIRWGLKLFPDANTCGVNDQVAVDVSLDNAAAIDAFIQAQPPPGGSTPTRAALRSGANHLSNLPGLNARYIVLATDGLPNCADGISASVPDADETIQAVQNIAQANIPVFVIGVGTIVEGEDTLRAMARAGGEAEATATVYFPASTTSELVKVLSTISAATTSCAFGLDAAPVRPDNLVVKAGTATIPRDPTHQNGWDYSGGPASIQLFGSWCNDIQSGTPPKVTAAMSCQDS